jgi:2-polyprenyl-6-methoxyphenol hydroxylase-like FAD-dependent oxidoreductase
VGCDGAAVLSAKRAVLNSPVQSRNLPATLLQVDIADPEKLRPGRNVTPTGMYLQSQPGYLRYRILMAGHFMVQKSRSRLNTCRRCYAASRTPMLRSAALHIATTWTDRARQATTYRNGRVLLAGDAAHIHAPLGGQGLNLGLGDAMNLGWKLAATIHNKAPEGLLDSYYTERHPIGVQVLDWSRAQVAIMKPDADARALYAIIRDLMDTRDGATYFAGRVWGSIHITISAAITLDWPQRSQL